MRHTLKLKETTIAFMELYEVLESDDDRIAVGAVLSDAALDYFGYDEVDYSVEDIAYAYIW